MPPVANTAIPAAAAAIIVADTVVAAQPVPAIAIDRFGRAALSTPVVVASVTSWPSSSPTIIRPPWIATVAGVEPLSRTAASAARATSTLCGYGKPWLINVDSSATTGWPAASASATSGETVSLSRRPTGMTFAVPEFMARCYRLSAQAQSSASVECQLFARSKEMAGRQAVAFDCPSAEGSGDRSSVALGRQPAKDEAGIEGVARSGGIGRLDGLRRHFDPTSSAAVPI